MLARRNSAKEICWQASDLARAEASDGFVQVPGHLNPTPEEAAT